MILGLVSFWDPMLMPHKQPGIGKKLTISYTHDMKVSRHILPWIWKSVTCVNLPCYKNLISLLKNKIKYIYISNRYYSDNKTIDSIQSFLGPLGKSFSLLWAELAFSLKGRQRGFFFFFLIERLPSRLNWVFQPEQEKEKGLLFLIWEVHLL